jgi:hypothetical protein
MKLFLRPFWIALTVAVGVGIAAPARATLINITNDLGSPASLLADFNKGSIGGLGNQQLATWLSNEVSSYNTYLNPGAPLAAPTGLGLSFSGLNPIDITGYSYAVIHYGTGPGGIGQGGGVVAWFLGDMSGLFQFDLNGSGRNGNGGISFVRLYGSGQSGPGVPEGGPTIGFLGLMFIGMAMARRRLCS